MQVHSATGGPKSSRAVPRSGNLNDPARLAMQTEREEQPISSKPGSRPVESEGDPVSLRDIEMILAPGISPPPLPTLARAPSKLPAPRRPVEPPAAEAPKAAPRWTAEAAPLRRRKERSPATAPDAAFQGLRLTRVADVHAPRRAIAERLLDEITEVRCVDDQLLKTSRCQPLNMADDQRLARHIQQGLWAVIGQWSHAGTQPCRQNHGFHDNGFHHG